MHESLRVLRGAVRGRLVFAKVRARGDPDLIGAHVYDAKHGRRAVLGEQSVDVKIRGVDLGAGAVPPHDLFFGWRGGRGT